MPDWGRVAKTLAPYAMRYGGCAAAVAVGGPAALAVAGIASQIFAPSEGDDADFAVQAGVGFGQAFASNINGLITNMASDRMKGEPDAAEDLPLAFRHALQEGLDAVRPGVLAELPDEGDWFENWERRFAMDSNLALHRLAGVGEDELLGLFQEGVDPKQALWPVAQRLLIGLDAEARRRAMEIQLKPRAMSEPFSALLCESLTADSCMPTLLGRQLAQHDAAWRRVMRSRTEQIHNAIAGIEGFPEISKLLLEEFGTLAAKMDSLSADLTLTRSDITLLREDLAGFRRDLTSATATTAADPKPAAQAAGRTAPQLPSSGSKFVGREAEVVRVRRLVAEHRLVTLAGDGGAGKTRLALEVARDLQEELTDGVWMIELASKVDPDVVPGAIAEALGLREQASKPPTVALRTHLADKRLLILLDNCEHLLEACVAVADDLLKHCPSVRILATSRFVLKTEFHEAVHWVGALAMPDPLEHASFETLAESDAVRLFVLRAKESSKFTLTRENVTAVATICRRLGGIPLAIELAAAHMNTMSPQELAQYLDEALELLVDDRRRERKEHMSVRETIRWSFGLLDDEQKHLMLRIAVFEGSLTSERVRAVCVPDWPKLKTLRCLDRLVEKSMVQVKNSPDGQERRLYLLETVQQFGVDGLQAVGELEELEERHAKYFLDLAEAASPKLKDAPKKEILSDLAEVHDDVRVALQRLIAKGNVAWAVRLGAAYWRTWEIRGLFAEGRRQLNRILAASDASTEPDARGRVLSAAGLLAFRQGDMPEATRLFSEALQAEEARDEPNMARIAGCWNDVGLVASRRGDTASAIDCYTKYLTLAQQHLGSRDAAVAHNNLGGAALDLERFDEAAEHLRKSYDLFKQTGNESDIAYPLTKLGALSVIRGDAQTAIVYLQQALTWRRKLENARGIAEALNWLGRAALLLDDQDEAERCLSKSLHNARQVEGARETADALDSMALLAIARREPRRALVLFAASNELRGARTIPRSEGQQLALSEQLKESCSTLTQADRDAAETLGAMKPLNELIAELAFLPKGTQA